nr:uncharacterized protein LOC105333663 [Crassostrea gigas]
MKALYYFLFLIESTGFAGCCSIENINNVVENANVSCSENLCTAQCYRDFIFPTGLKDVSYNCTDGVWTPSLSSCKRLPVVSITYSAQWNFTEFLPSKCDNISKRLDDLEEEMVGIFANKCQELKGIYASVHFNYSFLAFTVNTHFSAVYRNYTTRKVLNTCISFTTIAVSNLPIFRTMFDNVTCTGSNSSKTVPKVYTHDKLESCLNGTEVHAVTSSETGEIEQYCDYRDILTSNTSPDIAIEETTLSSRETSTFIFEALFISKDNLKIESIIYIAATASGVLLISVIIIMVVCVQKRVKSPKNLPAVDTKVYDNSFKGELIENELYQSADNAIDSTGYTDNTKINMSVPSAAPSFKGELIENELYQSADNAIDSTANEVNLKVNMSVSSAAPNCKDLTQTEQELEQDQCSYPSKCKETNLSVDGFKDEEIDKLYSNTAQRGHQKTLNFDPDSDCQYAVVRE